MSKGVEKLSSSVMKSLRKEGMLATDEALGNKIMATLMDLQEKLREAEQSLRGVNIAQGSQNSLAPDAAPITDTALAARQEAIQGLQSKVLGRRKP